LRHAGGADWDDWLHVAKTIRQHLAILAQQSIALREDWMRSPTVMRLEAKRLEAAPGLVAAWLGAEDGLLASGLSAVACAVGYGALTVRRVAEAEICWLDVGPAPEG
jgi:glutathione S-transferase